ncbi:hypothetical protein PIB30_089781, partial [Stylosanthes scabra]|nr:hypothetical protein [Stylosanthes scabra]
MHKVQPSDQGKNKSTQTAPASLTKANSFAISRKSAAPTSSARCSSRKHTYADTFAKEMLEWQEKAPLGKLQNFHADDPNGSPHCTMPRAKRQKNMRSLHLAVTQNMKRTGTWRQMPKEHCQLQREELERFFLRTT